MWIAFPDHLKRAIQVIEAEKGEYGLESLMNAVDLFIVTLGTP